MNRQEALERLAASDDEWDVLIIGGGATGLGAAVDAASRGYRTALIERGDFGCGTSSRSTKLIHGGVRYLRQANISLVRESLHERTWLLANAPHLVHSMRFVIPSFSLWDSLQYRIGLKLYDALAGLTGEQCSQSLSVAQMSQSLPGLKTDQLRDGVSYLDGQFNDSRFLVCLARTADQLGGTITNYVTARELIHEGGRLAGVVAEDLESGNSMRLKARVVVNTTGVFSDSIRRMDDDSAQQIIVPSQGTHIVLDRSFFPGDAALMIPKTDDGRLLFAIPWLNHVLIGTTDLPVDQPTAAPHPQPDEISYLLEHVSRYLNHPPEATDIRACFAGLRPLVSPKGAGRTASISREHHLETADSGLVTMAGGKWTTYRVMGEQAINAAEAVAGLNHTPSRTIDIPIFGGRLEDEQESGVADAATGQEPVRDAELSAIEEQDSQLSVELCSSTGLKRSHVVHACRHEMARNLEDVLSRRYRVLYLEAERAAAIANDTAQLMADELSKDDQWIKAQSSQFRELASQHLPQP